MADRGTWKIVIGASTLADYTDVVDPSDSDGGEVVQTEQLFRAASITNLGRDNFQIQLHFSITRESATNAAAADLFLKAPQTYNGVYDVQIIHRDHAGTETTRWLRGASVRVKCAAPIGVTNLMSCSIVGGLVADS